MVLLLGMLQKLNLVIGCKISAEATSESSGRGGSINCLTGDNKVNCLINRN